MEKVSAVYKIVNTVTGDRYVGSSKDVKRRWKEHKKLSTWKRHPNYPMYQDMQKYGVDKFRFQILCPVEPDYLKDVEQELIEMVQPTYNSKYAKGLDVERQKESIRKAVKKYNRSEKGKKYRKEYLNSDKGQEVQRKSEKKYKQQLCSYNGETLTLGTLAQRLLRAGVEHSTIEAKKCLLPSV